MGRIKSQLIKRTAQQLFDGMDIFNDSFENNKKLLKNEMPSKSVRNKIAGQLVSLAKKQKKSKQKKLKPAEEQIEHKENYDGTRNEQQDYT